MKLIVDDIHTTIADASSKEIARVHELLRARPSGYFHMPRFKQRMWDGYISLMHNHTSFPTGLLSIVKNHMEEYIEGIDESLRPQLSVDPTCLNGITLRDYQVEAANKLLSAGRGVAKMATNSGKTEVFASIIHAIYGHTVVVVHRKELLHQTADRLEDRLGCHVGKVGDGKVDMYHDDTFCPRVTVCMVQTLANFMNFDPFKHNEILIIDECHHGSSAQMLKVLYNIPGRWRYGFSGTPLKHSKLDDLQLIAATGDVVVDVSNAFLIEEGYSAKPTVILHIIEDFTGGDLDYQEAVQLHIIDNHERNVVIASVANTSNGVTLLLVDRIDHGKVLHAMIPDSIFVTGSDDSTHRQNVLDAMRTGESGVVIATPIFDEGVDIPSVDTVILAAGGKSQVKLLQRIGRGMRKKEEGDNSLIIHDFIDDTNDYLLSHSEERISIYAREGFTTEIVPVDEVL